jgi:CheY-like chemotaxis protein
MPHESLPTEAAQAQACLARRMEIVGQLTGGVVHDFNNILTVIAGTIDILAESVADRPELAAIAGLISEAASRGSDLTSHLLAFVHSQPSQPREVEVNALLVDAARLLRPTLGEQIEIDVLPATEVSSVWVDPSQLMTAILNLAIMARDAMPEGGKLVFEARNAEIDAGAGIYAVIAIGAAGYGTAADNSSRAFADLGVIEAFIERCNGHLKVTSETGRGTSVEIHLPQAVTLARSPAEHPHHACGVGGNEAILIVEDDMLVRKYVTAQVQSLGYRTLAAGDGREALAIIEADDTIDLLFTDVMMPGSINGWQLAIAALSRRPSLKVLYTSGYAENALLRDRRLEEGALLLAKPYRKIDLAKMIRTALMA